MQFRLPNLILQLLILVVIVEWVLVGVIVATQRVSDTANIRYRVGWSAMEEALLYNLMALQKSDNGCIELSLYGPAGGSSLLRIQNTHPWTLGYVVTHPRGY